MLTSGFDRNPVALNSGLELSRQYLDQNGEEVKSIKLGDIVNVVLKVKTSDDHSLNNIAIVELLPGGFELNQSPNVNSDEKISNLLETTYVDKREDRLVIFATIPTNESVYKYQIKAVNRGSFASPITFAESMYIPNIFTKGTIGKIAIE